MIYRSHASLVAAGAVICLTLVLSAVAGTLFPPTGPIQPTHRTIIDSFNTPGDADSSFRISEPGSYYLFSNLSGEAGKAGIEIAASGVTLDLNGFELTGVAGATQAIRLDAAALNDVRIHDGIIRDWPGGGIDAGPEDDASGPQTCQFTDITLVGNGPFGLRANRAMINKCIARGHDVGFSVTRSTVTHCWAVNNTSIGYRADSSTISHSRSDFGAIGMDLQSVSSGSDFQQTGCDVSFNTVEHATDVGIQVHRNTRIWNNTVNSCGYGTGTGIGIRLVDGAGGNGCNIIEGNAVLNSGSTGIEIGNDASSEIIRNRCHNNGPSGTNNYTMLGSGSSWGPILDVQNIGEITTSNPLVNLSS